MAVKVRQKCMSHASRPFMAMLMDSLISALEGLTILKHRIFL